jgi:GNAT superfamily N-acetyltransferase
MTMTTQGIILNLEGYTFVPPGKMATIVTFLQMQTQPALRPDPPGTDGLILCRLTKGETERYLAIYRTLGERWMWFSRLVLERSRLDGIVWHPAVEVYALQREGTDCGLLELDFREAAACEIAFFGLFDSEVGGGAGRWLMNRALALGWRPGISRVWVHTCHFDDPRALAFYQRSGFRPYKCAIEVGDDPRLNGTMRRDAAPHVPVYET